MHFFTMHYATLALCTMLLASVTGLAGMRSFSQTEMARCHMCIFKAYFL
jgi:hypothetical protein